ncbi:hypothetical protein M405DRAFT_860042 [Rhizopogon salebrosus TDB-379]|nr:hypothetical protein M405DRAFT_860042 [Rhizopogon salebrosus TDB-379]
MGLFEERLASRVEVTRREPRASKPSPNESILPPPAKWSPAADEPIRRAGDRPALYVPVQPSMAALYANSVSTVCWAPAMTCVAAKPRPDYSSASAKLAPSNGCFYPQHVNPQSHTQPSCNADPFSLPNSGFWYPQTGFHYQTGDVRMAFDGTGYTSQPMANRPSADPYGFTPAPRVLFGPHPPINYPASWIRA